MGKQTVHGSCHCGKVKFEAQVDFSKGTSRCNCTFCLKTRYWGAHTTKAEFKILQGLESLQSYGRGGKDVPYDHNRKHDVYVNDLPICKTCGVHTFSIGNIPEIGGEYVSVNVSTLDDVDFQEVMKTPVTYMDGRHDDWFSVPKYTRHM